MNIKNKIVFITRISLENYPSKQEVMNLLELFLYDNNYRKDYQICVENNILSILFHQSEEADAFIKHLRAQKMNNHLYSKLKITISFTPIQDYSSKSTKVKRTPLSLNKHKCPLQKSNSCPIIVSKSHNHLIKKKKYSELSINASEAFIDPYEKEKEEIRKNKVRWIDKRNFNGYAGKASSGIFGSGNTYVVRDPSLPPNQFNYNLRISKKYQWIDDKGFL